MNTQRMIITVLVCQGVSLLFFSLLFFLPYPNPVDVLMAGLFFGTFAGAISILAEWLNLKLDASRDNTCYLCMDTKTFYDPASGLDKPCTRC